MENSERQVMPPATFAGLGGGKIAYVRSLKSDEAKTCFPGCRRSRRIWSCGRCSAPTVRRSCLPTPATPW